MIDSGVLTKTFPKRRFSILWVILTVLMATSSASWISWLWSAEITPVVHPCIEPIAHAYSANATLAAWKAYLVKEKINIDNMAEKAIGSFILFVSETYSPCLREEMGKVWAKDSDWKSYVKKLMMSDAFIFSTPGMIAMLVILVQCIRARCKKGRSYKLLRKGEPHLMK